EDRDPVERVDGQCDPLGRGECGVTQHGTCAGQISLGFLAQRHLVAASATASTAVSRSENRVVSRQAGSRSSICCVMPEERASRECRSRQNEQAFSCEARSLMNSASCTESPLLSACFATADEYAAAAFQTSGADLSRYGRM